MASPEAECVPASYGDEPPDCSDRDVIIVDFSYPRDVLEYMAEQAKSLRVLDHHKTAAADLDGFPGAIFDRDRSGAGLAWDELVGGKRPEIVDFVEDRDLWRYSLPNSRAINAWISSLPRNEPELWLPYLQIGKLPPSCASGGRLLSILPTKRPRRARRLGDRSRVWRRRAQARCGVHGRSPDSS